MLPFIILKHGLAITINGLNKEIHDTLRIEKYFKNFE